MQRSKLPAHSSEAQRWARRQCAYFIMSLGHGVPTVSYSRSCSYRQGTIAQPGPTLFSAACADQPLGSVAFHTTGTVAHREDAGSPKQSLRNIPGNRVAVWIARVLTVQRSAIDVAVPVNPGICHVLRVAVISQVDQVLRVHHPRLRPNVENH